MPCTKKPHNGGNLKIKFGDTIQAGPHIFKCGDIINHDLSTFLKKIPYINMVYTDPPWNTGNCKYWRTIAHKDDNSIKTYHQVYFKEFLTKMINSLNTNSSKMNVIWIETSIKEAETVKKIITKKSNLPFSGEWTIYYGSPKRPNKLLRFSKNENIKNDPTGLSGQAPTEWAFKQEDSLKSKTVLDPCIGKGMTARIAYKHDKTCYGMELNPRRLQKTIEFFERKGFKAEKIS